MKLLIALVVILLCSAPSLTFAVDIVIIEPADAVLNSLTTADNLSVTAGGSIIDVAGANIAVGGQAVFNAVTGSITLDETLMVGGQAAFNAATAITLVGSMHFGALSATATAGSIFIAEGSDMNVLLARALGGPLALTSAGNITMLQAQGSNVTTSAALALINSGAVSLLDQSGVAVFSGDFTQTNTGALNVLLGGTSLGTFNRYTLGTLATHDVTLDGALNVSLAGGFSPNPGDVFDVLDWSAGTVNGAFSSVILPPGIWDTSLLLTTGEIRFVGAASAVPEPSTLLLLASGLTGVGGVAWRRRRTRD